jgi:hypothetical protein
MAIGSFWGDEFGWTDVCGLNPERLGRIAEGLCDLMGVGSPELNISVTAKELRVAPLLLTAARHSL